MAVCDPYDVGIDICNRVGGDSTEDHTDCYLSIDDHAAHGERELDGCDVGCLPCKDYPSEIVQHMQYEGGRRWLRPHPSLPARDAFGNLHDLKSGEAHPIPIDGVHYIRGQCYNQTRGGALNSGEECFGMTPCRCWRGASIHFSDVTGRCNDAERIDEVIESKHFYDSLAFSGWKWPPRVMEGGIHCRKFQEFDAQHVAAVPITILGMPAPVFLRYSQYALSDAGGTACAPNSFIPCLGRPRDTSSCLGYWRNDPRWYMQQLDPPERWLDDQNRFNYLRFTENTARFEPSSLSTPMNKVEIELKNIALNHVKNTTFSVLPYGSVSFDQLDRVRDQFDGAALWSRAYNRGWDRDGHNCNQIHYEPQSLIRVFPHCRTVEGNDRVTMRWYVLSVRYTILLVSQKYFFGQQVGIRFIDRIEYHARAQISVEFAWVGSSSTAEVIHDSDCSVLPRVERDRIVYKDGNRRVFAPIQRLIWLGYLGRLGVDGTNRYPVWLGNTVEGHCNTVANSISDPSIENPISGWPMVALNTPGRPSGHFAGRLKVEFPEYG